MENDNIPENKLVCDFLFRPGAKDAFALLDYALKNGQYIQNHVSQEQLFVFVRNNYDSLKAYYREYFSLYLDREGQDDQSYYFLNFRKDGNGVFSRGKIPPRNRVYLDGAYILVGFMFARMYLIDIEADSIFSPADFKRRVKLDYDEYKQDLMRLFANHTDINETQMDWSKLDTIIDKALREFEAMGWIYPLGTGEYQILPSSNRLITMYKDPIDSFEKILTEDIEP